MLRKKIKKEKATLNKAKMKCVTGDFYYKLKIHLYCAIRRYYYYKKIFSWELWRHYL